MYSSSAPGPHGAPWLSLLGRPRTMLCVSTLAADALRARTGAQVTALRPAETRPEAERYDLVLLDAALVSPSALGPLLQRLAAHVAPEGRLVLRRSARSDAPLARIVDAGLEALAPQPAGRDFVVARRPPQRGPLSLTVGMLTMNEEPSIAWMLAAIARYAPDARVLCVDSSTDRTPAVAERAGATVVRQLPPRGHGPAMERLMVEAAATSDALIFLDCDRTYPPELIPRLRGLLEDGIDVVNASRVRRRPAAMPLANYVANKTFAACGRLLVGTGATDLHSGMRAYRSSVLRAFAFDGEGDALPIDTLLWPARCGYRVVEIPIPYEEREGVSKLRKVSGTLWTFRRLARTLGVGAREGARYEVWPA